LKVLPVKLKLLGGELKGAPFPQLNVGVPSPLVTIPEGPLGSMNTPVLVPAIAAAWRAVEVKSIKIDASDIEYIFFINANLHLNAAIQLSTEVDLTWLIMSHHSNIHD